MKKPLRPLAGALCAVLAASLHSEPSVRTVRENGAFLTEGSTHIEVEAEVAADVISDVASWGDWIFAGLDGSDPVSAKYVGIFRDVEPDEGGVAIVYDVNLVWPFGSYGNRAPFTLEADRKSGTVILRSRGGSIAYDYASFEARVTPSDGGVRADFRLTVKFSWIVDPFMSLNGYSGGIDWRLARVTENFIQRCIHISVPYTEFFRNSP